MKESYQKIIVVSVIVFVLAAILFGVQVLERLERITQVAERTEEKLDRIVEVAAPMGHAAVEKGVAAIKAFDAEGLGESATKGLKEVGTVAKDRLIQRLEKKKADAQPETNGTQEVARTQLIP